ncbi:MAG TPA: acyl-CoA desaturase [Micromonosporaceae bacterium]|nr:acyl-CoA desaturase [Micromonosporaceae bacterium]
MTTSPPVPVRAADPTARRRMRAGLPVPVEKVVTLLGVTVPVAAVVLATVQTWNHLTTWRDIWIFVGMYFATAFGVTVGFHRMTAHRAFDANPVVKFVLLALGCMAGMMDPIRWSAIHLQHHARSDRDGDPHSPLDGLWHAHIGWFLPGFDEDVQTYARGVAADRMMRFFRRTYWGWAILAVIIPYLLGGWRGVLWGTGVRLFFTLHMAFSVNSVCHTFGRRDFQTGDRSRNQWFLGFIALGEGWHNNHHAFPRSAFHGLRWWQVDVSGYAIRALEQLRLASNVHRVSPALMNARRITD